MNVQPPPFSPYGEPSIPQGSQADGGSALLEVIQDMRGQLGAAF